MSGGERSRSSKKLAFQAKSARRLVVGAIIDTKVTYRLEPDGDGTRVFFEYSDFEMWQSAADSGAFRDMAIKV